MLTKYICACVILSLCSLAVGVVPSQLPEVRSGDCSVSQGEGVGRRDQPSAFGSGNTSTRGTCTFILAGVGLNVSDVQYTYHFHISLCVLFITYQ